MASNALSEPVQGRYAKMLASSATAAICAGEDNLIVSWNTAAEEIFGYSAEEAIGQPLSIIVPLIEGDWCLPTGRACHRFRVIFEAVHDGLFITNGATGEGVEVNHSGCGMSGYEREELIGRSVRGTLSSGIEAYTEQMVFERGGQSGPYWPIIPQSSKANSFRPARWPSPVYALPAIRSRLPSSCPVSARNFSTMSASVAGLP